MPCFKICVYSHALHTTFQLRMDHIYNGGLIRAEKFLWNSTDIINVITS